MARIRQQSEPPVDVERDAAADLRQAGMYAVMRFQPHPIDGGGRLSLSQVSAIEGLRHDDRRSAAERLGDLFELLDHIGIGDDIRRHLKHMAECRERWKEDAARSRAGLPRR